MSFKPFKYALLAAGFGSAALLPFWSFAESAPAPKRERTEIHFSADQVEENSETKVITATGNVNIVREGTTLKADKITYDRKNDKITADGHVNIIQPDGTTVFADSAELEDKMSKGAIHEVKMILADESRVAARRIKQSENKNKYFFYGVYSPCDVCEDNPSPPVADKSAQNHPRRRQQRRLLPGRVYPDQRHTGILYPVHVAPRPDGQTAFRLSAAVDAFHLLSRQLARTPLFLEHLRP